MDMNLYASEVIARHHLAELRAEAARHVLARSLAPARPPLRVSVGHALIRMGTRLLGGLTAVRASA